MLTGTKLPPCKQKLDVVQLSDVLTLAHAGYKPAISNRCFTADITDSTNERLSASTWTPVVFRESLRFKLFHSAIP